MGSMNNDKLLWDTAGAVASRLSLESLSGKSVLLTGSTGLIGSQIVRVLLKANENNALGVRLILPVRNVEKAKSLFGLRKDCVYYRWSLGNELRKDFPADYIIHAACTTSSKDFSERPVETAISIVKGTYQVWQSAERMNAARAVLLSTMEVYGETTARPIHESDLGFLDSLRPRNSYPEAKLMSENIVSSFWSEYGLSSSVVRLTQTFGQGVKQDDGRVFAEFGRSALSGENIVLFSDGKKRNTYLSVDDAVRGILTVLLCGEPGKAYNLSNDDTYCSILDMAHMVLERFGKPGSKVEFGNDAVRAASFRKGNDILLDTSAIRALGWEPSQNLEEMYRLLFASWGVASQPDPSPSKK
ncbi:NAD(P)-dependent oxidoreductase [Bifidobacterium sp. ESL0704]|uniref:NAD-dependent epimerase/dehydratase family protein n=1 Tax=Bifidobacterium sp. ESL0704 TaxID=2983219 RepID=UPI0023FA02FB|nr:NAD(P)-dependent oxidoreductase [Bifidobacterium sp. ESL0704]WEV52729.1 NAD(P)-dependent oxidoreductase [Bifidobacterium sp. ESL0704]